MPEVAKMAGKSRRTMFRLLMTMHARDRSEGKPTDWLFCPGKRVLYVNMGRLYAAHPALFEVQYATKADWEEHEERLDSLESHAKESGRRINAVAARVRELASTVQAADLRAAKCHGVRSPR